jgi:hypothetical protein
LHETDQLKSTAQRADPTDTSPAISWLYRLPLSIQGKACPILLHLVAADIAALSHSTGLSLPNQVIRLLAFGRHVGLCGSALRRQDGFDGTPPGQSSIRHLHLAMACSRSGPYWRVVLHMPCRKIATSSALWARKPCGSGCERGARCASDPMVSKPSHPIAGVQSCHADVCICNATQHRVTGSPRGVRSRALLGRESMESGRVRPACLSRGIKLQRGVLLGVLRRVPHSKGHKSMAASCGSKRVPIVVSQVLCRTCESSHRHGFCSNLVVGGAQPSQNLLLR